MKLRFLGIVTLSTLCALVMTDLSLAADSGTGGPSAEQRGPGGRMGGRRGPGGPGFGGGDPEVRVERLDTDSDGKVSLEEFLAPRLSRVDDMFSRLDSNGDGLLEQGEGRPNGRGDDDSGRRQRGNRPNIDNDAMIACVQQSVPGFTPPEGPGGDGIEGRFADNDSNGDGKLSLTEVSTALTTQSEQQFGRLDTDSDGYITSTELDAQQEQRQAVAQAMRQCARQQRDQ